jgi:hypothetical protein
VMMPLHAVQPTTLPRADAVLRALLSVLKGTP